MPGWLYTLIVHESSHLLHLDAIGGPARLYNRVFGKTWSSNHLIF